MVNVFAIIVAVGIALRQIKAHRGLQKQNNSIAVMKEFMSNDRLIYASGVLTDIYSDANRKVEDYAHKEAPARYGGTAKQWVSERADLFLLINYLEIISVGIDRNIYDRDIIYQSSKETFTRTYARVAPLINKYRNLVHAKSFAENFERIAKDFDAQP